jgi:hypothetical protein
MSTMTTMSDVDLGSRKLRKRAGAPEGAERRPWISP